MSDYFDIAYYVSISVGKWNKDYEIVEFLHNVVKQITSYKIGC